MVLVIEDAEILGCFFSRLQCREQIKQMLTAYEEIRRPRCEHACQEFLKIEKVHKCPVGLQQEARDASFQRGLARENERMDEALFPSVWQTPMLTYAYDASEAVDDWWTKWGSFLSPSKNIQCKSALTDLQVCISVE